MSNILLVDDDHTFQFLGVRTLNNIGVANDRIHSALDGQKALNLFNDYYTGNKSLPDVILLDLNMPVMDGFSFMEAFQKLVLPNKERVKIVVVTSSNNSADRDRAMKLGASQYIQKPLTEDALKQIVNLSGADQQIHDLENQFRSNMRASA